MDNRFVRNFEKGLDYELHQVLAKHSISHYELAKFNFYNGVLDGLKDAVKYHDLDLVRELTALVLRKRAYLN